MERSPGKRAKLLAAIVLTGLSLTWQQAQAVPIEGDVEITGLAIADGPPDVATRFDAFLLVNVLGGFGDYASVTPGTSVVTFPFSFAGSVLTPAPLDPLWSFSDGGLDYSFVLDTVNIEEQGRDSLNTPVLNLSGTGVARITGFDDTQGTWSLTAQGRRTMFSFSSSSFVSGGVPDGGSTLLLLGSALTLLGFARMRAR
jgi:hypothetical protein